MRAFTYYFGTFTCLLGIACVVLELQTVFRLLVTAFVVITVFLVLKYSKCQNCNEYAININPLSKKFGICRKCGNKE